MGDTQHTPGPWEVAWCGSFGVTREAFVRRPEDDVAIAAEIIDPDTGSPSAANARLIAAAPELLEALERALRWFDGDFGYGHEEVAREGAAVAARAAIEKARGGR